MPRGSSRRREVLEESLASRLALGPLPLAFALRCATDVAAALRKLHQDGRAHGQVSPASIVLRPGGAALLPTNRPLQDADLRADVAAFGAVLYEMLTGGKPPRGGPLAASAERVPHPGPSGLRAAATRLAARCLATPADEAPSIQMVVTEVRLLSLLARQSGAESLPPPQPASPSPPSAQGVPARAAPAESFVRGVPTKEFVSAMLSPKPVSGLARYEPDAELLEKERDGAPRVEEEVYARPPTARESCPKCGSRQVHESRPRTKLELLLANLGVPICRCHRCFHRYLVIFRFAFSKLPLE